MSACRDRVLRALVVQCSRCLLQYYMSMEGAAVLASILHLLHGMLDVVDG